jgi:hypothetical protein
MALMTDAEKLAMVKTILNIDEADTSEDTRIATYLTIAGREILTWRYSYGTTEVTEVPADYEMTQIYAVVAGYSQSGAENQRQHTENGISRVFRYADMIQYIRSNVVSLVKVL